jgi:hypothetical protein
MFKLKPNKGRPNVQAQIKFNPDRAFLDKVGKYIRDEIVKEAKRQAAMGAKRSSGYRPFVSEEDQYDTGSTPEGIPRSSKFFNSFQYRIVGGTSIEVYSTWPWISQIVEGRPEYKMTWLTQDRVKTVPMKDPTGKVIFRSTPASAEDAWVHPGFASHDFITQGWKKALPKVKRMYALEAFKEMTKKAFG